MKLIKPVPLLLLLWTFSCIGPSGSENILFFFMGGSFSHKVGIWPLVVALAERGHNVTFTSPYEKQPFPSKSPINDVVLKSHLPYTEQVKKVDRLGLRRAGNAREFWNFGNVTEMCHVLLANPLNDPKIDHMIHRAEFDLVFINTVFGECGYILNHRYKAKTITSLSSFMMPWLHGYYGMPPESSWVPDILYIYYYPMTLLQRMWNGLIPHVVPPWRASGMKEYENILRQFYGTTEEVSLVEMEKNASLVFLNNHLGTTDLARSLPPFFVPIGGMQCWLPKKELPEQYRTYLDGATNGAVLMSFGSATDLSDTPKYFKEIMFYTFERLPDVRFIIKWTGALPPEAPKNVMAASWIPQFEILSRPNVKAFISHAGGNGFMEAVYYGVPIVAIPLYADQDFNGYVIEATNIGIRLELETMVPQDLYEAVKTIMSDDSYAKEMKIKSGIFRDRPTNPIESAVFWTEYALRHDDLKLLKPLQHLSTFEHYSFDACLLLFGVFTTTLVVVFYVLKCSLVLLCSRKRAGVTQVNLRKKRD